MHKIDCEEFIENIPTIPIKCNLCNEEIRSYLIESDIHSIQCPKTSQIEFRVINANHDVCSFSCKDVTPEQEKELNEWIVATRKSHTFENKQGIKINSFNFGLVDVNSKETKTYFVRNEFKTLNLWVFGVESESKEITIKIPNKLIQPGERGVVEITWSPKIHDESGKFNKGSFDSGHRLMLHPVPTKTAPELKLLYPKKVWVSA